MKWVKGVKEHRLPVIRFINQGDVMYSVVTTVKNTAVYICKWLRE